MVAAFLAGVVALYVQTVAAGDLGRPADLRRSSSASSALIAVCAVAFTLGALFPGRFTAPIVAVGPW